MTQSPVTDNGVVSKFMKNTGWLLFQNIFRMVLSLIVTALMARYLDANNFGLINYGMAYIAIFTVICNLGIDSIIVNEIIIAREDTGIIVGTTVVLRLLSAIFSIVIISTVVAISDPTNKSLQIITMIQSLSLLFVAFDTVTYWFQSNLQSKYAVLSRLIAFTIVSMWRVILVYMKASVAYFAAATIVEAGVVSLFVLIIYFKFGGQKLGFSVKVAKQLVCKSYHFMIAGLLITIYTQIDRIMLGHMSGESAVGLFTAAMSISSLWVFIPNSLIESARPLIVSHKLTNEKLYIARYKQLYCAIIWISIIASIFITFFSRYIIIVLYGRGFTDAVTVLSILIWSRIFSLIGSTRSIWLISENKIKYQKYFVGLGATANVILNLTFIPRYGILGSTIATIFAEVLSSTVALLFFRETRPLLKLIVESLTFRGVMDKESLKMLSRSNLLVTKALKGNRN